MVLFLNNLDGLLLFTFLPPFFSFCALSSSEECGISALGHFVRQQFPAFRFPHPLPLIFPMIANFLTSQTCKLKCIVVFPNEFPTLLFASVQMFNKAVALPSQLYPYSEDAGVLISTRRQNGFVASLADIGWIDREEDEDDEDFISGSRWESHSGHCSL